MCVCWLDGAARAGTPPPEASGIMPAAASAPATTNGLLPIIGAALLVWEPAPCLPKRIESPVPADVSAAASLAPRGRAARPSPRVPRSSLLPGARARRSARAGLRGHRRGAAVGLLEVRRDLRRGQRVALVGAGGAGREHQTDDRAVVVDHGTARVTGNDMGGEHLDVTGHQAVAVDGVA